LVQIKSQGPFHFRQEHFGSIQFLVNFLWTVGKITLLLQLLEKQHHAQDFEKGMAHTQYVNGTNATNGKVPNRSTYQVFGNINL
jgi:hypothetical protein